MTETIEKPATDKATKTKGTEYLVLIQDGTAWVKNGTVVAASAPAAVRARAQQTADDGTTLDGSGVYVAVPLRSWHPHTIHTKTKTVLTLT